MKKTLSAILAIAGWLALALNFKLKIIDGDDSLMVSLIVMFSYFTILTNFIATLFFTYHALRPKIPDIKLFDKAGTLTALASFLCIVGLVFHFVLAPEFEGLQLIASEINHTLIPVMTVVFWFLYEDKLRVSNSLLFKWLAYPLVYITLVILRGVMVDYYPYFFIDVSDLGPARVALNSVILLIIMILFMLLFKLIGRFLSKSSSQSN